MRTLRVLAGMMVLVCTTIVRGQDLSFQIQAGSATDTLALASGPNDIWTYSPTGTLTVGSAEIYAAPIQGTGQSGLVINADPSISYGFGVTNTSSTTQTFTFTFPALALAINLPAGTYNVSASYGNTLTPAPGDTAQFSLVSPLMTYQQSFINGVNAGVDIVTPPGDNPETVTSPANSADTEAFSFPESTGTYTLTTTGTTMSVTTTFDLSPGDSASFSGSFVVTATPEPSSAALGLLAALGFAFLAFRARPCRS